MISLAKYSPALKFVMLGRVRTIKKLLGTSARKMDITKSPSPFNFKPNNYSYCTLAQVIEKNRGYDYNYMNQMGLRPDRMPAHVAITLDGNRRWCRKNGVELTYQPFYNRYIMLGELCIKLGIPAVSNFIFSTCTWKRTDEANGLMFRQFQASLEDHLESFLRKGTRVSIVGHKRRLPQYCQDTIQKVEEKTKGGKVLHMLYGIAYGGRCDVLEASRSICEKVMNGEIEVEDIDEALVAEEMSTWRRNVGDPDLMIRNGAKNRISNYYLWQAAHAELYFTDSLSSDFGEPQFLDALRWFQHSQRRFGN